MLINFREIQRRVQARIQNTNTSTENDNDLLPKIKDWANERYDRIYTAFPWVGTIDNYDLTLIAGQEEYVFDRNVYKAWTIFDRKNARPVREDNIQNHIRTHAIDLEQVGNTVSGDPVRWRRVGTRTSKASIGSTPETVEIVSSVAGDVAPNCVRVMGLVGGVLLGENLALAGDSPITSGNTYDANQELKISVGTTDGTRKNINGKVTVSGTTSLTEYSSISPQEFAHEYHWFRVSPVPNTTGTQPTWQIWHSFALEHLRDDNDIPVIDCADEIVQGCFADALREDGLEQESSLAEQKFVDMVKELMSSQIDPDEIEQFKPSHPEAGMLLDFGRIVGSFY